MKMKQFVVVIALSVLSYSQQPQTASPDPQALQGVNAKWANGVAPGYWPYQKTGTCTGLNLCISPGTVAQCMGSSHVEYAGTTSFALTNNTTNYIYLDLDNSCVPAVNTSGYSNRNIAIAKVTTVSGAVTQLKDDRTWNGSHIVAGSVNAQIGTTYTINATDRMKLVTATNSSAQTYTLPTTLGASFLFAFQNLGTGTVTMTPSSGTVNNASTLPMTTGTGGWFFFDGTNWEAVTGGGGSSGTGIKVNTSLIAGSNGNFNSTTPSAGAGFINCTWQKDTSTPDTNISVECPDTRLHGLIFTIFNPAGLVSGTTSASYDIFADVPIACTISAYSLAIDTGTITVKWWKKAAGTAIPTSTDSINTSGVGISSGTLIRSTTLTDFITTSVAAHDAMIMDITAVTGSPTILNGVLECGQ